MDYQKMTSPCGLDCFNCPAYLANEDMDLRKAMAERFHLPIEQARCGGCRNDGGTISFLGDAEPCEVFKCASGRSIAFCCECADFPCDHLHPYADRASSRTHNTKLFNLCLIRKLGVERWAREKASRVRQTYFHGTLRIHASDDKR